MLARLGYVSHVCDRKVGKGIDSPSWLWSLGNEAISKCVRGRVVIGLEPGAFCRVGLSHTAFRNRPRTDHQDHLRPGVAD